MEKVIRKTDWTYRVWVSKDSPFNTNRGFTHLPDTEYHRQHWTGIVYTDLRDAEKSLEYYQKGYIEKYRNVTVDCGYGRGTSYRTESKIIKKQ